MFDRDRAADRSTGSSGKFAKNPMLADANIAALNAGHAYGETAELPAAISSYIVDRGRRRRPALYRTRHRRRSDRARAWSPARSWPACKMFFGGYPITPASPILHTLVEAEGIRRHHLPGRGRDRGDLRRDRRVAMPARSASPRRPGPGIALKGEAMGLAIDDRAAAGDRQFAARRAVDRPADQDRAVRSLPGGLRPQRRHADAGDRRRARRRDCFECAIEAVRIAVQVHDAGDAADRRLSSPTRPSRGRSRIVDDVRAVPGQVPRPSPKAIPLPIMRDAKTLARAVGQARHAGPEHRIGGIEKDYDTGNISLRAGQPPDDDRCARGQGRRHRRRHSRCRRSRSATSSGKLAVVGWGSTYGPIHQAVRARARARARRRPHPHPPHLAAAAQSGRAAARASTRSSCPR